MRTTKLTYRSLVPSELVLSSPASAALDFVRGLAAFFVMIGHLRALFFVTYSEVENPNVWVKAAYFLTGFGYQAVIVFFVLSGFFIASSIFRLHHQGRWAWPTYLAQRLVRLWVVLIPALFLTAFWDSLGIVLFGDAVYRGLPQDKFILGYSAVERLNPLTFVSNVLFLQGIATPTFGSNGPLWSLSYEFWYYIAFPCALNIFVVPGTRAKVFYGALLVALGVLVGKAIALSFAIWLLGVAVIFLPFLWHKHVPLKPLASVLALVPFAAALVLSVAANGRDFSLPIALSFAALMYAVFRLEARSETAARATVATRFSKTFAGFSYSLYLLHLPPLVFLHAYLHALSPVKWQPSGRHLAAGIAIAAGAVAYAWLVSRLTEARTPLVRDFVKRRFKI